MLVVPMLDHRNEVLGVLQLINAVENHQVIPFDYKGRMKNVTG
jgi:hypothetical protein